MVNLPASVTSQPPVIGLFAHTGPMKLSVYDMPATFVPQSFQDRVSAGGGVPVLLPPLAGVEQILHRLDGLLLLAGPDVDPALYAAPSHPQTRADLDRDRIELAVLNEAISIGMPLLGICRGLQLLNTACGGTLHQHLPEVVRHERHSPGEVTFGQTLVQVEPASRTAAALASATVQVPCHHHQAVDLLGDGLAVTARAEDGTVEAMEIVGHPFAVAVQWHAEQAADNNLFVALVEAARQRREQ